MRRVTPQHLIYGLLLLWIPGMLLVVAALMVNHTVAMPSPGDLDVLAGGVQSYTVPDQPTAVHVIYEHCSCTRGLIDHLEARGPRPGTHEPVLFVGADGPMPQRLREAGFPLEFTTRDALERDLALVSAPVLVALDPDGALLYAGGYFRYPAAQVPLDVDLLDALDAGEPVDPLPVFGCAVSAELQDQIDPLGLQSLSRGPNPAD